MNTKRQPKNCKSQVSCIIKSGLIQAMFMEFELRHEKTCYSRGICEKQGKDQLCHRVA